MIEKIALRLGVDIDDEIKERVANDQVRMVWAHAAVAAVVATVFAVIAALQLMSTVAAPLVYTWIVLKLAVAAPRVVWSQIFRVRGYPSSKSWRQVTYGLLALDGAVWGLAGFWLMGVDTQVVSLVTASLCCVACVATFGFQVNRVANASYVVPIIVPMILGMLMRMDAFGLYGAAGLSLFLLQILITAHSTDSKLSEVFLLRIHSARISVEKAAALKQKDEALTLAERQSAVKSQFLGTVSHELRTPIHGMLGIARLVHVKSADPALRKHMELVEASGTHLLGLVTDLIDVSRIDGGEMRIQKTPFDLSREIERVAAIYAVRAAEKGLHFTLDCRVPDGTWVLGDAARVRQVLHNLLGNAIKFTVQGFVRLTIDSGDSRGLVRFKVSDSGIGICKLDQKLVFRAFEQVQSSADCRRQGTGLGLTIAHEIAVLLGGSITLTSLPGAGSTFEFSAVLEPTTPRVEDDDPEQSVQAAVRGGARILLAEDNDVNYLIASSMLANQGHHVERAHDGIEAVQRGLREIDRPDLILMDGMMPNMDGFEATRSIRAQERAMGLRRVPIIALSAIVDNEAIGRQALECGMDAKLGKPFSSEDLDRVMRPWLAEPEHHKRVDDLLVS